MLWRLNERVLGIAPALERLSFCRQLAVFLSQAIVVRLRQ